jgi:membrane-associated protease RseP (regulator of RpoE activity)
MFKKFIILASISLLACAFVSAQQQPAPGAPASPKPGDRNVMFFSDDGGYLGVMTVGITNENFSKFGLKEARGVGIEKVMENSPASQAGLQNGDVILRFDGEEVKSVAKLSRMIGEVSPDQKIKLTILRGGSEQEIIATMGKRSPMTFERMMPMGSFPAIPNPPPSAGEFKLNDEFFKNLPPGEFPGTGAIAFNFFGGRKIGVVAEPLTKQLGETMGVADGTGLLLMEVRENSAAVKAGLKAGDIIIDVDGTAVSDSMQLVRAINAKKEGDVEITVIRDKNRQKVRVTPEHSKEGDTPTFFQTAPGANGEKQTFIVPRAPAAPETVPQPGTLEAIPALPALPAMPAVRTFRRVL